MDTIITIITSAAFGTIIATVLTLIHTKRSESINYTANERSLWRKELKHAMKMLQVSWHESQEIKKSRTKVEEALAIIECRLNPYSKYTYVTKTNQWILKDGHIWDAIKHFRECKDEQNLDYLIACLQMLLKFDWELSKRKIRANRYIASMFLLTLLGSVCLTGLVVKQHNEASSIAINEQKSTDNNEQESTDNNAIDKGGITFYVIINSYLICLTLFLFPTFFCFMSYSILSVPRPSIFDCIIGVFSLIVSGFFVYFILKVFGHEIIGVYTGLIYAALLLVSFWVYSDTQASKNKTYINNVNAFIKTD